ncbi:MAG: hypothetical protein EPN61_17555 [Burkholderiaceae bacterium]|nr:MAG: hypothetical protein EPN61_17555 [Burkholderiaceae bacterium]
MPRRGHRIGPPACPPELQHYETRYSIRLKADKLTRLHRQLARDDPAVASHLQRRIREPARFAAMMAGRTKYTSDTPCGHCGSTTRTVYGAACWTCQTTKRPLQRDSRGKVSAWPAALRSRDGWLALCEQRKRERSGQRDTCTFGPFTASSTPTGKLSIQAPALGVSVPDASTLSFDQLNKLVRLYPEFLELLEWAGWV